MRVLVADDNAVVRLGVQAVLEQCSGVEAVLHAADGVEALEVARAEHPDLVLLDVRMPHRDGIDVLAELSVLAPVLMLTHSDEPETIRAALDNGAKGYLVHGELTVDEIEAAVCTCVSGGMVLGRQAAEVVMRAPRRPDPNAVRELLSRREQQIMDAVAQGLSNAEIAAEEFLAPKTVKNHVNNIYAKLGVSSRAQAVARWLGVAGSGPSHPSAAGLRAQDVGPRAGAVGPRPRSPESVASGSDSRSPEIRRSR